MDSPNAERDDRNHQERFEERQRLDVSAARAAIRDLTSMSEADVDPSTTNPLVLALQIVGKALGIEIRNIPTAEGRDPLQTIAEGSGVRIRRVVLPRQWYRGDFGPLLGFLADTEEPVPILPAQSRLSTASRYDVADIATGRRRPVDGAMAARLSSFGYTLYRPLPEKASRISSLLSFALSGFARDVAIVILCGAAVTLLGMLLPMATAIVVDYAIPGANRMLLLHLGLGLGAASLGTLLFDFAQAASLLRIETAGTAALQSGVWSRLLDLRPSFFRSFAAGDLHARASGISSIRQRLGGVTITTLFAAVASLLNAGLMLYYNPLLGATAIGLTIVIVCAIVFSGAGLATLTPKLHEIEGYLSGLMVQLVDAAPKLRVAGAEKRAFAFWAQAYGRKQRLNLRVSKLQDRVRLLHSILPAIAPALIYAMAISLVEANGGTLTLGVFLAFNASLATFLAGVSTISETGLTIFNVGGVWNRTRTILDAEPEVRSTPVAPIRLRGSVRLDRVTFRYQDYGPPTLDDVTIEANPGECIALAGPSGGGKSTILSLLLGFEKPLGGGVYYDNQDLKELNINSVRRQIGVVMQENKVLAGSIFDNIVCGSLRTVSDAWEAARAVGLADDIERMPMGMHTIVSEGGSNLSGGQRQRLLIARALILKPSILVLDEATSALDNRTQAIVIQSLEKLKITRILVAHRLSTIRQADRIYVIDGGQIVQVGSFERLARQDGLFARLMSRQMA